MLGEEGGVGGELPGVQVRGEALGGPLGGPMRQIQETWEEMA